MLYKMRYKTLSLLVIVLFSFLFINLISAEFIIGNNSGDIDLIYGPSQPLRGWINVSFNNEPANTVLSSLGSDIKVIDFIRNNSIDNFNCTPPDCTEIYEPVNGEVRKDFIIRSSENKIIGLKFSGRLMDEPIKEIFFNISTDVGNGCSQQLKIDISDDNDFDWIPTNASDDFNCSVSWGCYDISQTTTEYKLSSTAEYCEKIRVLGVPAIRVGAHIIKHNANNGIRMIAYDMDSQKIGECNLPSITSTGEYACVITNLGVNETDLYVCIKGDSDYGIKGENAGSVCGFYDINNHEGFVTDYSIFAQGGKYAPIGSFVMNQNSFKKYDRSYSGSLIEYLNNYLDFKYDNNCQNGCVVPIKFYAGQDQNVTVSALALEYSTTSGVLNENRFYDVNKKTAKLSSDYLKLDLEKAGFNVSSDIGNQSIIVRLGDTIILRKDIQIKSIPQIKSITPTNPAALVLTNFLVTMERWDANTTYKWNFGDNSTEETTDKNTLIHAYPKIGNYKLRVKAIGRNGETSKTADINVVSPKSLINETIADYKNDIKKVESEIAKLPAWIKNEAEKRIKLAEIKDAVSKQEKTYQEGYIDDEKAVQIMKNLMNLKIPDKVYVSKSAKPFEFFMNKDQIDIERLSGLGAGKAEKSREEYAKGIAAWTKDSINITAESKTYSLSFRNRNDEILFTELKIYFEPKETIKELYFIVNGDPDNIIFSEDMNIKADENSAAVIVEDLSEPKTIELLYPETVDALNLPVYVSPEFKYLSTEIIPKECNLNKICEKELNENYKNCSDCKKPWLLSAMIWIIVLLAIAFIVYIILQEWYKRYYERHLFPDRNQLYNLINFINNSEVQGISREELSKKLRNMGWSGEQLAYAWKKLHGKRTGMWEIPIFKGSENIKVREELQKRQNMGNIRKRF